MGLISSWDSWRSSM